MRRTRKGWELEYPQDLRGFTHQGVTLKRTTQTHEAGRYVAIDEGGATWTVTGDGSNRYPWRLVGPDGVETFARNLIEVAEMIAAPRLL